MLTKGKLSSSRSVITGRNSPAAVRCSCIIFCTHGYAVCSRAGSMIVNFLVPDCAILPRLFFRSALLIPIPLSSIVSVLASCRPKGSQVRVQAPHVG